MQARSEEVLEFWFPDLKAAGHARMVRQFEWWFRGGALACLAEGKLVHTRSVPK